jgi:hypothetical protein
VLRVRLVLSKAAPLLAPTPDKGLADHALRALVHHLIIDLARKARAQPAHPADRVHKEKVLAPSVLGVAVLLAWMLLEAALPEVVQVA